MQHESADFTRMEQGQYKILLHNEMLETTENTIYFSLPGQADYLYEYEGNLEEALDDLPKLLWSNW